MKITLRDGSGMMSLKYLVEDTDRHGNVRVYFRRPGFAKVRLLSVPGTEAFTEEYRTALEGRKAVATPSAPSKPGSLKWLIQQYYGSSEFKRLKNRTVRSRILDAICDEHFTDIPDPINHGGKPAGLMRPKHVRKIRDAKSDFPEAANARVKALRQVYKWGVKAEHVESNPANEVEYIRTGSEGFHTWTVEEVEQYEAHHPVGTKARLALDLLLLIGPRRSDVVRFGRQMERSGATALDFTEVKGSTKKVKRRLLPILPRLRVSIDATPSGHLAYLVTTFNKPFTANGFGNWFRKRCDEAGLPHCSAHGLRKAGATIAANNGATENQLMAIYGWESPKQAALYTRKVNREKLARDAMHMLEPERKSDKGVPLQKRWDNSG